MDLHAKQGKASILPFLGATAAAEAMGHRQEQGSSSLPAVKDLLPPGTSLSESKMAHALLTGCVPHEPFPASLEICSEQVLPRLLYSTVYSH